MQRDLLTRISEAFFGYGDLQAPLWFVGYEEHCADEDDARRRLPHLASLRGAVDVFEAHRLWDTPNPENSSTWPEMQRIMAEAGRGRHTWGPADRARFSPSCFRFRTPEQGSTTEVSTARLLPIAPGTRKVS
jgi:hypothetical protein